MTVTARRRQVRGMAIGGGGWLGQWGDPAAIPPNSAYNTSSAGVVVNERSVLSLMVVASCIRVLGDASSGLEPHVHRQIGSRRSKADPEVDAPGVILDPYVDMDREEGDFRRVASLALNGNMYTHVADRDSSGWPTLLEVLNPSIVNVEMVEGRKTFRLGAVGRELNAADMVHVPWLSLAGGVVGLNPIELGSMGFGTHLASNEYAARYFAQGMHPTGILSIEKPMLQNDIDRVEQQLFTKHGGLAQSHTPIVLDAATKWQQISVSPDTAQLLQTRAFSRSEIAGFYGVPPHLVGDSDQGGVWGKGLQELVIGFALFSLNGYVRRLDRADTQLLPPSYYVRRNVADLFKTNDQALALYMQSLRMNAIASANECREMAGLQRSDEPGADSIFAPINSAHADFLAAAGEGPETGLPGGLNPKGVPGAGPSAGGSASATPHGGA